MDVKQIQSNSLLVGKIHRHTQNHVLWVLGTKFALSMDKHWLIEGAQAPQKVRHDVNILFNK